MKRIWSPLVCLLFLYALQSAACKKDDLAAGYPVELYDLVAEFFWTHPVASPLQDSPDPAEAAPDDGPTAAEAGPTAQPAQGRLLIPYGQQVDLYVRLPQDTALTIGRLRPHGDGGGTLVVSLQRSEEERLEVARLHASPEPQVLVLPRGASEISRLSLAAEAPAGRKGSLVLTRPKIRIPTRETTVPDPASAMAPAGEPVKPNVILYLVDTLRKDHLGVYGYDLPVSPNIDAFARDAVVFDDMVAQAPWTKPSVASIFTGLEPHLNQVRNFETSLPEQVVTLAEALTEAGYRSDGFIANLVVRHQFGFAQGFKIYQYGKQDMNAADGLTERVLSFMSSRKHRPFFLHVHAMDPHSPYRPPEMTRQRFAPDAPGGDFGEIDPIKELRESKIGRDDPRVDQIISLYDAEIAFVDHHFGLFLAELKRRDLYDDSLIVFVGDHGQEFWDRGSWGHGHSFYDEVIQVPLIIKPPGATTGFRVGDLVQHVDLYPTILDFAGVEAQTLLRGSSLRGVATGEGALPENRSVYSCVDFRGKTAASVATEDWRLIVPRSWKMGKDEVLFRRREQSDDIVNLFSERPVVAGYMLALLQAHESAAEVLIESETSEVNEETLEQLRALGYLD